MVDRSTERVQLKSAQGSSDLDWRDFVRIIQGPEAIMLFQSDYMLNFNPKRAASREQAIDLVECAASRRARMSVMGAYGLAVSGRPTSECGLQREPSTRCSRLRMMRVSGTQQAMTAKLCVAKTEQGDCVSKPGGSTLDRPRSEQVLSRKCARAGATDPTNIAAQENTMPSHSTTLARLNLRDSRRLRSAATTQYMTRTIATLP
ncbi:YcxB family protein [Sphingomonas folli]|uniref:YcxB family protein n=1 Tax=Sphingomonas folli TaxID=2862497 RepID=UPI00358DD679